jgi:hypothetical protein
MTLISRSLPELGSKQKKIAVIGEAKPTADHRGETRIKRDWQNPIHSPGEEE